METLWLLLIVTTTIVYPVVVIRSALRGRQWAVDTLTAMRYLGGDLMPGGPSTTSAWLSLPPEHPDDDAASDSLLA